MVYGDLVYAIGVPFLIRSWGTLNFLVRALTPIVAQLPFSWLYPTGSEQEKSLAEVAQATGETRERVAEAEAEKARRQRSTSRNQPGGWCITATRRSARATLASAS